MALGNPTEPRVASTRYAERLAVPWWWWLIAVALAAALAAEIWRGASGVLAWLPFALLLPVTVGGLWWLGRIRIAVTGGEFRVDDARLPVRFVADAIPLDASGRRELLGPGADPLAFVIQRPWVSGAVQVLLDDPADPTPYWLISSRDQVRLAEAIMVERRAVGDQQAAPAGE